MEQNIPILLLGLFLLFLIGWSFGGWVVVWRLETYRLLEVRDVEESALIRFNISFTVQRLWFKPKKHNLSVLIFDGDLYINDGYMTPLIWESGSLADQVTKELLKLDINLV